MPVLWTGFGGFHVDCVSDGNYRFCNGILYRVKTKNEAPDALLLYEDRVERLKVVSRQFSDADAAFAFARQDGELLRKVLDVISSQLD